MRPSDRLRGVLPTPAAQSRAHRPQRRLDLALHIRVLRQHVRLRVQPFGLFLCAYGHRRPRQPQVQHRRFFRLTTHLQVMGKTQALFQIGSARLAIQVAVLRCNSRRCFGFRKS